MPTSQNRDVGHPAAGLSEKPHVSDDETVANMGHPMLSRLFAEVGVVFVDPVLAGRGEDGEVDAVFLGGWGVGGGARDGEGFCRGGRGGGSGVEIEKRAAPGDEG